MKCRTVKVCCNKHIFDYLIGDLHTSVISSHTVESFYCPNFSIKIYCLLSTYFAAKLLLMLTTVQIVFSIAVTHSADTQ